MRLLAAAIAALVPFAVAAEPGEVVFSELMWMGSTVSSADEWIELANRSAQAVDLSGWTITRFSGDEETTMLVIESGSVAPGSVFLIANYSAADANSALAAVPDLVTAAVSLPNTRLRLRLYAGDPAARARLVDEADDGSGVPLAGDGDLKRSMVRVQLAGDGTKAESWATATVASGWDPGATEMGTPGSLEGSSQGKTEGRTGGGTTAVRGASWARLKGSLPWCR